MTKLLVTAMLLAALSACGKPEPPPKVEDTVFGDTVGAKERARIETERAMEEHKKQLDDAMKKQEAAE